MPRRKRGQPPNPIRMTKEALEARLDAFLSSQEKATTSMLPKILAELPDSEVYSRRNEDGSIEVYLDDVIHPQFGVSARGLAKALEGHEGPVTLRVNSPGGSVFEARQMMSILDRHSTELTVSIEGVAASASTFFPAMADNVEMTEGSRFFIHRSNNIVIGNEQDMTEAAEIMRQIDAEMADLYAEASDLKRSEIVEMMNKESLLTAEQALAAGFVDEVVKVSKRARQEEPNANRELRAGPPPAPPEPPSDPEPPPAPPEPGPEPEARKRAEHQRLMAHNRLRRLQLQTGK